MPQKLQVVLHHLSVLNYQGALVDLQYQDLLLDLAVQENLPHRVIQLSRYLLLSQGFQPDQLDQYFPEVLDLLEGLVSPASQHLL